MQSLARAAPGAHVVTAVLRRVPHGAAPSASAVARVVDPEMPMLTLDDLGVLRGVEADGDAVTVTITPTYSGCPAIEVMRDDLRAALTAAGFRRGRGAHRALARRGAPTGSPTAGRRKLAEHGIAPPDHVGPRAAGPIPLTLDRAARGGALPALRLAGHRGVLPVRPDGLHGAAPLHRLPGAVRAHEGDLR